MFIIGGFRNLNIADWFSIYRILAFPFLILLMLLDFPTWFAVFLLLSFSTDMVDGILARRLKMKSVRGAQLDSIGDALTFVAGLAGVFYFHWAFIKGYWLYIVVIFCFYLLQLILAFWRYGKPSSFHTYLAKTSALFQGLFLVTIYFFGPQLWLFYPALVLSFIETLEEIVLILLLPKWEANVKGLWWALRRNKS